MSNILQVTLDKLSNFLTQVKLHAAKIKPKESLCLPQGWLVAEASLNNEINDGLRCMMVKAGAGTAFTRVREAVVPKIAESVKPNSAAALLEKLQAAEAMPAAKALRSV